MEIEFKPHKVYLINLQRLQDFETLSIISFGLSLQLLFKYPKEELKEFPSFGFEKSGSSYSRADIMVDDIEEICGWISIKEYADKIKIDFERVKEMAKKGDLGPIISNPNSGELKAIWPPEYKDKPIKELPEVDKKSFNVKLSRTESRSYELDIGNLENFEDIQRSFLGLAHSVGEPDEASTKACEMLFQSCLILQWTAFESYIRSTVDELFTYHPEALAKGERGAKAGISYEDLFNLSKGFSNIGSLKNSLVQRLIEQHGSEGNSVHGLINYIKSLFNFEEDPYKSWFVLDNERFETSYGDLMEIKDTRNALLHDGGLPNKEFFKKYPNVPRKDDYIIIDADYLKKCKLVLRTIAGHIANLIIEKKYQI